MPRGRRVLSCHQARNYQNELWKLDKRAGQQENFLILDRKLLIRWACFVSVAGM